MNKYVKLENIWWQYDESTPKNKATIENYYNGKYLDVDLTNWKIVEAKNWSKLNWKGTCVYGDNFNTGWLTPKGKFFGCNYRYHNLHALMIHGCDEKFLEKKGWIKITYTNVREGILIAHFQPDFKKKILPTVEQFDYLEHNTKCNYDEVQEYAKLRFYMNEEETSNTDDDRNTKV